VKVADAFSGVWLAILAKNCETFEFSFSVSCINAEELVLNKNTTGLTAFLRWDISVNFS